MALQYTPQEIEKMDPFYNFKRKLNAVNWNLIVLAFMFILTVVVLVTIFLFIPRYVQGFLDEKNQQIIESPPEKTYSCDFDIYNCGNFTIQSEAQDIFNYCGFIGLGDVHGLDADGNGEACESLPLTPPKK